MFFRVITLLFISLSLSYGKSYTGCGSDEKSAREELARSIYVSVETTFKSEESLSGDKGEKSLQLSSKQETNLDLLNVQLSQKGEQTCASVTTADLKKSLSGIEAEVKAFDPEKLPKNRKQAYNKTEEKLNSCQKGITLAKVLGDKSSIARLQKIEQKLLSSLEGVHLQWVSFNLLDKSLKIYIDGDKKRYSINEEIPIKVGQHTYTISSNRYCDIVGDFQISGGDELVIDNIDLEEYLYPKITFTSNKEKQYISLTVDGEGVAIGKEDTFKKCDGKLIYSGKYKDGEYSEIEDGEISLSPGLEKSVYLHFLSIGDIKELQNEAKPYINGERLEFLYSYGTSSRDRDYNKDTHNFALNKITHKKYFRYGYGLLWGADDLSAPETKVAEFYYLLAIQFTSFGSNELPLRIANSVSFIPYLGAEIGVGYHQYRDENGDKVYKYPTNDDLENDKDEWKFGRDTLVVKPIFGIDFIISKGFAFKIFAEKNLFISERTYFGTGLSVQF
jgi:hypothetical protein